VTEDENLFATRYSTILTIDIYWDFMMTIMMMIMMIILKNSDNDDDDDGNDDDDNNKYDVHVLLRS